MSDETNSGTRLDVDLEGIVSPNATVSAGTYTIQLREIKPDTSKTNRPMLRCSYMLQHPDTNETVFINDYPLMDTQQGKFRLKQLILGAGYNSSNYTLEALVGTQYEAELEEEDSADFGPQNRLKRLLVDVR